MKDVNYNMNFEDRPAVNISRWTLRDFTHIQSLCTECLEGNSGHKSIEQAEAWAKEHICQTSVCKACRKHVAEHVRMNKDGVCWNCFHIVGKLPNGKYVTDTMLKKAFEMVQDPVDWKYQCEGVVRSAHVDIVTEAIRYFAGGGVQIAQFTFRNNERENWYKIYAPGYYAMGF